ncbi:MAG: hypothetical protein ACFE9A_18440, partial [Candidatus Hodarchaeota archaeon]
MDEKESTKNIHEMIKNSTEKIFKEWESLDRIEEPSQETLEFSKNIEKLVKEEVGIGEDEIKVKKSIQQMIRRRKDIGEIIYGNNVIKRIEIIDEYKGYVRPLRSVAYYQLLPIMDARTPIARVL